jgi:hypothetical protein
MGNGDNEERRGLLDSSQNEVNQFASAPPFRYEEAAPSYDQLTANTSKYYSLKIWTPNILLAGPLLR